MLVLRELLDRAVVDDQDRPRELAAERLEPHPARGRLLGAAAEPVVGLVEVAHEQIAAVVEHQVGVGAHDLPQVPVVLHRIAGGAADDPHAARCQVVARVLLGRIQVAGRDQLRTAALQGQKERDRLRLEVDPGSDHEALERPRLLELVADRGQQPAALDHPLDPVHRSSKDEGPQGGALLSG